MDQNIKKITKARKSHIDSDLELLHAQHLDISGTTAWA